MSFGVGTDMNQAFVGSDDWGGPVGGVEMIEDSTNRARSLSSWHGRISPDMWTVIIIIGALGGLWFLGGVVLRNINVV